MSGLLQTLQQSVSSRHELRHAWMLVAAATSCSLGSGREWLPQIFDHASVNASFEERRQIFRILKESLVKASVVIGVARPIETLFAFGKAVDGQQYVRPGDEFRLDYKIDEDNQKRAKESLWRVYKHNLDSIYATAKATGFEELIWMSEQISYGLLLSPCNDTPDAEQLAPLTFAETEIVLLSCLICLDAPMTTRFHLRGALRSGLNRPEVETIHQMIEQVALSCGKSKFAKDMPRAADIHDDEI